MLFFDQKLTGIGDINYVKAGIIMHYNVDKYKFKIIPERDNHDVLVNQITHRSCKFEHISMIIKYHMEYIEMFNNISEIIVKFKTLTDTLCEYELVYKIMMGTSINIPIDYQYEIQY